MIPILIFQFAHHLFWSETHLDYSAVPSQAAVTPYFNFWTAPSWHIAHVNALCKVDLQSFIRDVLHRIFNLSGQQKISSNTDCIAICSLLPCWLVVVLLTVAMDWQLLNIFYLALVCELWVLNYRWGISDGKIHRSPRPTTVPKFDWLPRRQHPADSAKFEHIVDWLCHCLQNVLRC
jgi:hypothetical protein